MIKCWDVRATCSRTLSEWGRYRATKREYCIQLWISVAGGEVDALVIHETVIGPAVRFGRNLQRLRQRLGSFSTKIERFIVARISSRWRCLCSRISGFQWILRNIFVCFTRLDISLLCCWFLSFVFSVTPHAFTKPFELLQTPQR